MTDTNSLEDVGDIHLDIGGLWLETILYEIPLLALTSEAYFRFCDRDWNYEGQEEKAYKKAIRLLEHGCTFSEFGTRRRRDRRTQEMVMHGLMRAAKDADEKGWPGKLTGTSNVRFAMECDLPPIGTVAHEWFMGIASITNDYEHANETALRYWVGCFGEGVLGIALTDTFGTPTFLKSFKKSLPVIDESDKESVTALRPEAPPPVVSSPNGVTDLKPGNPKASYHTANKVEPPSYAKLFNGVRQDSGDPLEYIKTMRGFYDEQGITEKKTIVFSDSLNVGLCLEYKPAAEKAGFNATFGIGTNLTSKPSLDFQQHSVHFNNSPIDDFMRASDKNKKSLPPNIVIKISSASGRPAIKISDNIGKNTGDAETVHKVKETLGYVEKQWADGDEKTRYVEKKEQPLA